MSFDTKYIPSVGTVMERGGAKVILRPDLLDDNAVALELHNTLGDRVVFGFDRDELEELIEQLETELIFLPRPTVGTRSPFEDGNELLAADSLIYDDTNDQFYVEEEGADEEAWRDLPLGDTHKFMLGDEPDDPEIGDRLTNRIVFPFQVGELYEMIGTLPFEDVVEFHVPVGGV
jgi:hypothetical protein